MLFGADEHADEDVDFAFTGLTEALDEEDAGAVHVLNVDPRAIEDDDERTPSPSHETARTS